MTISTLPTNAELVKTVIKSLQELGGIGSNDQIRAQVIQILSLPSELADEIHSGKRTKLEYKLAWARTIAKQKGLIESTSHKQWKLV